VGYPLSFAGVFQLPPEGAWKSAAAVPRTADMVSCPPPKTPLVRPNPAGSGKSLRGNPPPPAEFHAASTANGDGVNGECSCWDEKPDDEVVDEDEGSGDGREYL